TRPRCGCGRPRRTWPRRRCSLAWACGHSASTDECPPSSGGNRRPRRPTRASASPRSGTAPTRARDGLTGAASSSPRTRRSGGTVHYNHTRIAHLTSRVRGVVREVHSHLGQRVKENDVLAVVDSREVGEAKSALLRALVQVDIKRKVFENLRPESAPAGRIREAEAELRQVRIELQSAEYA